MMQVPGLLSVIIVNWNTRDLLLQCIESVRLHVGMPHEIVVVDNASSDGASPVSSWILCLIMPFPDCLPMVKRRVFPTSSGG